MPLETHRRNSIRVPSNASAGSPPNQAGSVGCGMMSRNSTPTQASNASTRQAPSRAPGAVFSGAFRRSELVAPDVPDLDIVAGGIRASIQRSKTDQEGQGHTLAILAGSRLRIVEAVTAWLEAAGISDGPVFRSVNRHGQVLPDRLTGQSVALVVKRYAAPAGLPVPDFSGKIRSGPVS